MSVPITYDLSGPGIEIRYRRGDLTIDGDDLPLGRQHFVDGENLTAVATEMGTEITAVILSSSRNGTKITLRVLLPEVLPGATTESEVTGVAVITRQFRDVLDGPPDVLQEYDVRPLTGSVSGP
ncbi:hypothetical protein [Streptomyces sp. NBC_00239]|uniref:hypothetical protein n=1 Tax=Streptomyces sp. NBC_00239 TaxID=2903640 RepID=UPI002E28E38B|nr:hypothetical protein [Streptomyces sp. NBC_00239]